MAVIFDSGLLDFAQDESQYVEVVHNLGKCPEVIQFVGEKEGEVGFPRILNEDGTMVPNPYLTDTTDHNKIKVFKPNAFEYDGQFRIKIYG